MNPEELAEIGIEVHIIKGYGDTAVAECAFALMWACAKGFARMDREMRVGNWLRTEAVQLTGKTLGLIGFGGIAAEMARLALGAGMQVIAWNRTPKSYPGVKFVSLEDLLAKSQVISLHLLLNDETKGFISRERIAHMKDGVILVNTARGAVIDEKALIEALGSGKIAHAGLDVFDIEPLPKDHPFTQVENVTLSAHSAFRTPEASDNLIEASLNHCRRISGHTALRRTLCVISLPKPLSPSSRLPRVRPPLRRPINFPHDPSPSWAAFQMVPAWTFMLVRSARL
jgi:D-3-phosphoglycerate dehydrogenase